MFLIVFFDSRTLNVEKRRSLQQEDIHKNKDSAFPIVVIHPIMDNFIHKKCINIMVIVDFPLEKTVYALTSGFFLWISRVFVVNCCLAYYNLHGSFQADSADIGGESRFTQRFAAAQSLVVLSR